MRQPILYANELWKRQRLWALVLVVVGTLMSGFILVSGRGQLAGTSWVWLLYAPCGLLYGGLLLYYRWRSYVQITDAGLKMSNLLSTLVIEYDRIRLVRVQPLERHFEESRRRLVRPINRPLLKTPALFLRLRGDEAQVAAITKKLGKQLASEDTIALPIPDPDAMAWELSSRLPERTAANLGGQRRRKRAR
jgi:hypothetical protein